MHFASFDLRDPVFDAFGFMLSVQVVTLSNVYGIDPAQTSARREEDAFVVRAAGLAFAGQQERAPGAVLLRAELEAPGRLRIRMRAKAPEPIRCVKLLWRGLATPLEIVEDGRARAGGETLLARFEDRRVREKRFAVAVERTGERAGQGVLELIHEQDASRFERELEAPPCVLARGDAARAAVASSVR